MVIRPHSRGRWAKGRQETFGQTSCDNEKRTGMLAGITNAIAEIKPAVVMPALKFPKMTADNRQLQRSFDKKHLDKVITSVDSSGVMPASGVNY